MHNDCGPKCAKCNAQKKETAGAGNWSWGAGFVLDDIPSQTGKVLIITGGTAGLGLASAVELAKKGAHVIITARSAARGEQVLKDVARQVGALGGGGAGENFISSFTEGTGTIEFGVCQNEDLASMKDFAIWFLAKGLKLDVLMLNAGVAMVPFKLVHGVESQLFINHVAHHYLTSLLLHKLKDSCPSRVVVVSSDAHEFASNGITLEPPLSDKYSGWGCYCNSKLANIHFTTALAKRLAQHRVYVNAVHPGAVNTNIPSKGDAPGWIKAVASAVMWVVASTKEQGALTQLYVATSPEIEENDFRGKYFYPVARCKHHMKPWASDASVAQEVWEWTENKIAEIQMGMQDKTEASPQCHEAQHVKTLKKLDPDSPLKMAGKEDEEKDLGPRDSDSPKSRPASKRTFY